jgi:hypothetical protein
MKHFTTEQWIDFVNEAISAGTKQDMEKHLEQGCEGCNQTVSLWRRVRNAVRTERNYQPPPETLQIAQITVAPSKLALAGKEACTLGDVLFDSFLQPMFEGARSSGNGARQMLYRADPYQIDLQIETESDENTLVITGQLLDLRQPGVAGCDVLVVISNLRGQVVQTKTNRLGEFRKEIPDSGELEFVFPGLTDKPVIISLRDPLGHMRSNQISATASSAGRRVHTVGNSGVRRKTGGKS